MGVALALLASMCAAEVLEAVEVSVHDALEADLARRGHSLRPAPHPQARTGTTPLCAHTRITLDALQAQARQVRDTREGASVHTMG